MSKLFKVKLTNTTPKEHHKHYKGGYLFAFGEVMKYRRGEAIKKAKAFGGKIEEDKSFKLSRKITISFDWWNEDRTEIPHLHQAELENQATDHINEMMQQGFSSGELIHEIDGVEYKGWFEVVKEY